MSLAPERGESAWDDHGISRGSHVRTPAIAVTIVALAQQRGPGQHHSGNINGPRSFSFDTVGGDSCTLPIWPEPRMSCCPSTKIYLWDCERRQRRAARFVPPRSNDFRQLVCPSRGRPARVEHCQFADRPKETAAVAPQPGLSVGKPRMSICGSKDGALPRRPSTRQQRPFAFELRR
jgi:hypothetical protein